MRTHATASDNTIATAYNQWSETYETMVNATRDLAAQILRQEIQDRAGKDVLEIGCGTGVNTRYLAEGSKSVIGLDFSEGMLAQARVNVPAATVRFVQGDLQQIWPIADATVDLIVCTLVLEHIQNLTFVFAEAARVLRPSGAFFLCELHPFRQWQGRQAQFTDANGNTVLVTAYIHNVSEYLDAAFTQGFSLTRLGEWRDANDKANNVTPRILSLQLLKQ